MRLNLGSKNTRIDGFINLDIYEGEGVDVVCDISKLPYDDETIEEIYASHCLEHFTRDKTLNVLKEWNRVLINNGKLYLAVPDFDGVVDYYTKTGLLNDFIIDLIYGLRNEPYNYHYIIFNYANLKYLLHESGFSKVERVNRLNKAMDCSNLTSYMFRIPMSLNVIAIK